VVAQTLAPEVVGTDVGDIPRASARMARATRNLGRPGVGGAAIAAVDFALWDLKARLLDTSVVSLIGRIRDAVPAYGSGGFTSYSEEQLAEQLGGWADDGMAMVKMKIGREPAADYERVLAARRAIGNDVELFVDANGAYTRKQALAFAPAFADLGVSWFEEPVSSDDLDGLRLVRNRAPEGMEIAAGEYAWTLFDVRRMLTADAVDVLQIDGTRCGGFTGFLRAAALCEATPLPCSAHTSPNIHAHVCCCVPMARHVEYFHDHVRIERMLFDGVLEPIDGMLRPRADELGVGMTPRFDAMERFIEWRSKS
jgi:L-alanine-DL-glutamate epimerase-like enolase superfamily enzyme